MPYSQVSFDSSFPVRIQQYGIKNQDTIFYVIKREGHGSGFFSNVFHVMGQILLAKRFGMTPIVDMLHFPTLYTENEPVNGTENAWEYYFEQPCGYTLEEVYESKSVVFCDGTFNWSIYDDSKAVPVAYEYIRVRKDIEEAVARFADACFTSKKVLGVHFRGQEQKTAPNHPTCPTVGQMLDRTHQIMAEFPVDRIFFVSEEQRYLDIFRREFGDMVLATDAFRTYEKNAYTIRPYPRPLHMYKLGLEVLQDTMLLAKADYLLASGKDGVASGSNVSQMAQVWNAGAYRRVELIYNGMNPPPSGKRLFLQRCKKALLSMPLPEKICKEFFEKWMGV